LSTPGIERLDSGVTNSRPVAAAISAFSLCTSGEGLESSSWLWSGRSPMCTCLNSKSAGASSASAVANLRLKEARRRLPTTTAIWDGRMQ
jgi:hypothetical protein